MGNCCDGLFEQEVELETDIYYNRDLKIFSFDYQAGGWSEYNRHE